MDQVALDRLAARASAAGFSSIAEYAENLEQAIEEITRWNYDDFPEDAWRMVAVAAGALGSRS